MKTTKFIFVIAGSVMMACSNPNQTTTTSNSNTPQANEGSSVNKTDEPKQDSDKPMALGESLMKNSDCYSCHLVDTKLVGPSFIDIANKYTNEHNAIKNLIDKVVNGGAGVWGEIPMQAHKQLTESDANEMIVYILSLSNK